MEERIANGSDSKSRESERSMRQLARSKGTAWPNRMNRHEREGRAVRRVGRCSSGGVNGGRRGQQATATRRCAKRSTTERCEMQARASQRKRSKVGGARSESRGKERARDRGRRSKQYRSAGGGERQSRDEDGADQIEATTAGVEATEQKAACAAAAIGAEGGRSGVSAASPRRSGRHGSTSSEAVAKHGDEQPNPKTSDATRCRMRTRAGEAERLEGRPDVSVSCGVQTRQDRS